MALFRILTIGDPHFKSDNGETTEELTEKVVQLIKDRADEIDAVAVLGDILHRHEKVDLHPFHRAHKFLSKIHRTLYETGKIKFLYILVGNHDRSNNRVFMTDEHVFGAMKQWEDTFVVDTAMIHQAYPDFKILLMPYVPPGRFQEGYQTVISEEDLNNSVNLVLAHQEFHGAKMNTITSNEGDPWDSLKPLCVSGHIHDYQELKSNMIYVGTPIQHGFADISRKTVSIFTFTGPREFTEERIDLKIKGRTTVRGLVRDFESLFLPEDQYFVKVKLSGTKRELKLFQESDLYKSALERGIIFQFLEIPTVEILDTRAIKEDSGISFGNRLEGLIKDFSEEEYRVFKKLFR